MKSGIYKSKSKVIVYPGMSGWRFLVILKKDGVDIKEAFGKMAKGWGSIPVLVTVGKTKWNTSIFPDKRSGTYFLPLKAQVRRKEKIVDDDIVSFTINIQTT